MPPTWCSVDLRDGNQALAQPMSVEEKLEYGSGPFASELFVTTVDLSDFGVALAG